MGNDALKKPSWQNIVAGGQSGGNQITRFVLASEIQLLQDSQLK